MKRSVQSRRTAAQMQGLASVRKDIRSQDQLGDSKYLREFTQSFTRYECVLSGEDILHRATSSDIVLIGDYHALPASQHFAADLLEKAARERRVVLALEAVLSRDQQALNAWWRREISAEQLRSRLRFDREWGYPWEPLYKLMSSARDYGDGLYGLDCMPRGDLRSARMRDRHASAKIREINERHPGALVFVLFGESHLAPQHLPAKLRIALPAAKLLTILQNVDAIYWKAASEQAAAVSMNDDTVCVFNSSPLEKYETYRLCLERWKSAKDEQHDFAPAIYNLIFSLARSIGFRIDSPRNGTQPRFLADSLPEVVSVDETSTPAFVLEDASCRYLAGSNQFIIKEFHIAEAALEAARFLHFACVGTATPCVASKLVENALAQFGARLLSPVATADGEEAGFGGSLYRAFIENKVSKLELRQLFLSHLDSREDAERACEKLKQISLR